MMAASFRLAWATRSGDERRVLVLAVTMASFAIALAYAGVSGAASVRAAQVCSALVTVMLIGMDFPGAGGARFREFELSLPVAPRERARASLLLSLGFWLLPSLAVAALAQVGAFGADARRSWAAALGQLGGAGASVLLAVALRHTLGLTLAGWRRFALRAVMMGVVAIGLLASSPAVGLSALALAAPLLAIAHRAASRAPELALPRAAPASAVAPARSTFRALVLRYCLASAYGTGLLLAIALWTWMVTSGWISSNAWQALFVAVWAAYYAHHGARLLRLGHLPVSRGMLFRFIVWPQLVAIGVGVVLSLSFYPDAELGRLERVGDGITLQTPQRLWRLASGEPPVVTSPRGESHRPRAHGRYLGSSWVAYDPYEVPPGASREFLVHQLGRLLADEHGLAPSASSIEERYLSAMGPRRRLDGARHPELRSLRRLEAPLVGGVLVLLLVLTALRLAIHPGPALSPREARRQPGRRLLVAAMLCAAVYQALMFRWRDEADPIAIALHAALRLLTSHLGLVVLLSLALGALLYRAVRRRFEHMEAPERAKSFDDWFAQI